MTTKNESETTAYKNTFPEFKSIKIPEDGCNPRTCFKSGFDKGWDQCSTEIEKEAEGKASTLITGVPFIKLSTLREIIAELSK